jgi:hypothetical protein
VPFLLFLLADVNRQPRTDNQVFGIDLRHPALP